MPKLLQKSLQLQIYFPGESFRDLSGDHSLDLKDKE
jgi:hypothetical protein